jgi:hypothetical protein
LVVFRTKGIEKINEKSRESREEQAVDRSRAKKGEVTNRMMKGVSSRQ